MDNKKQIRRKLKKKIEALSLAERERQSVRLSERIVSDLVIQQADHIGVYLSLPDEPDIRSAIQWLKDQGKALYLPIPTETNAWGFARLLGLSGEATGPWGLEFPPVESLNSHPPLEIILIPGRGFTTGGHRIGRGKGIYDRLLEGQRCRKIGIGFDCQIEETLPQEPTDVILDEIWTP